MSKAIVAAAPLVAESWGYTNVEVKHFSFKWTIDNFSFCPGKCGDCLKSPSFPAANSNSELKWSLLAYPKGFDEGSKDHLSLFLILDSYKAPDNPIQAQFVIAILNSRQKGETTQLFFPGSHWGCKKFVLLSSLFHKANDFLPEDRLTVFCKIAVGIGTSSTLGRSMTAVQFQDPASTEFGGLLESQRLSDVVLVSDDGQEFAAHKAILAARSPVFAAMFEHDMLEKEQSRVEIKDMEPQVLQGMLRYMYTGRASDVMTMSEDLLVAAERYALDRLKLVCEEHISSILTISRAAEFLIIADQNRAECLKANVIDFIRVAASDVIKTDGWNYLIQTHPDLHAAVFCTQNALKKPRLNLQSDSNKSI